MAMPSCSPIMLTLRSRAISRFRKRYPDIDIAIESEVLLRILDAAMND